jgi:ribosomal protein S2
MMYQYLASDYYATGEGRTICLLITRAYPKKEDYEIEPQFVDGQFVPGTLKNTDKFRAAREFIEEFDEWMARGAENLPKEEFIKRFQNYLPKHVETMMANPPGNFNFKQRFYFNYA